MIKITIGGGEKGKEHITRGQELSGMPLRAVERPYMRKEACL
jgi:hypothetical protein